MKRILASGITGQQGVALIENRVLAMGSIWHPTGGLEAGIDGFIEFRDPTTGVMLSRRLAVQSKATAGPFSSETPTTAAFICGSEDLEYWMKGDEPIILVLSRPATDEAYWASIKDYFRDPVKRKTRKIIFDKTRERFDESALPRLLDIAASSIGGTYLAPRPAPEPILSNLLRVTRLPERVFHAYTELGGGKDVRAMLKEAGAEDLHEWSYRGKQILSVHDLSVPAWRQVCDPGTVEEFDAEEWASSLDEDRQSDFIHLLNECLRTRLQHLHVRYDFKDGHYHFTATKNLQPRIVNYRSLAKESSRKVFLEYSKAVNGTVWTYYRHNAFEGRFRRFGTEWFLQIDPTYRFTTDGRQVHPSAPKLLSGIHKLERNQAVLGQVVMWASLLKDPDTPDMFAPSYSHLAFGQLLKLESPVSINDDEWLRTDEDAEAQKAGDQGEVEMDDLFAELAADREEG